MYETNAQKMNQKIVQTNTTQRIYKTNIKQVYIFVDKMYEINIHIYMYLYKIKYTRHSSLLLFQLAISFRPFLYLRFQ